MAGSLEERTGEPSARAPSLDGAWKELDGFKGFTLLIDRESGKGIGTTYWESKETMDASEEAVRPSRERAVETGGGSKPPQVERFEVAVDTMV